MAETAVQVDKPLAGLNISIKDLTETMEITTATASHCS
jgi:Asp-tRNA(Asn)/Glu-tRNA(Gln) amidotransferase A subunit family amidase